MKELEDFQHLFNTDLNELLSKDEDDINFIEQNHYGDMLIEETNDNFERFRLWRNLDDNGGSITIEHCGKINNYTWETVYY